MKSVWQWIAAIGMAGVVISGCAEDSVTPNADVTNTPLLPPLVVQVSHTPSMTYTPSQTPRPTATPTVTPDLSTEAAIDAPTETPFPDVPPTAVADAAEGEPVAEEEERVDAVVRAEAGGLRLRRLPQDNGTILLNLPANTNLKILGRSTDNNWVLVQIPEGFEGWVWASLIDLQIDLTTVAAIPNPEPAPYFEVSPPPDAENPGAGSVFVSGGARDIYLKGQALGNRRNVFTKVGDSITASSYFMQYFVRGYNLGDFGYLLPTLQYFSVENLGDSNSFGHSSIAAVNGWISHYILDPAHAPANRCQAGESALECEYRIVKPAIALIMIGTNDSPAWDTASYSANIRRIVEISIEYGVIPVLSTLPPHVLAGDEKIASYNAAIRSIAATYDVPLWDYAATLANLPGRGMGADGIHPSVPPVEANVTTFAGDSLNYGYTVRNLTALQMLDMLLKQVMY